MDQFFVTELKFNEYDETFRTMNPNQFYVVAALALERLWTPYVDSLNYAKENVQAEQEINEILQIAEQWMQMIWKRIKSGLFSQSDYEIFKKLCYRYETLTGRATAPNIELSCNAIRFENAILNDAECFFIDAVTNLVSCVDIVCEILDNIIAQITDMLEDVSPELWDWYPKQYKSIMTQHPVLNDEIKRITMDIELARNYPQNMNKLLQKKAEYHESNFYHIKPLKAYGIDVDSIKAHDAKC